MRAEGYPARFDFAAANPAAIVASAGAQPDRHSYQRATRPVNRSGLNPATAAPGSRCGGRPATPTALPGCGLPDPSVVTVVSPPVPAPGLSRAGAVPVPLHLIRSEEHTSELQSRENLVCR